MSELDRQRAELIDLREDLEEHKQQDDMRFEEIKSKLDYICQALDWLVKAEKGEVV